MIFMVSVHFWLALALFGACVGAFLNLVIVRVPDPALRLLGPARRYCPTCESPTRAWDNIPIVSYLLLQGRCRGCQQSIDVLYPLVEFLGMLVPLLAVVGFGLGAEAVLATLAGWLLVVIAVCDWRSLEIPLRFPLAGFASALAWAGYTEGVGAVAFALADGVIVSAGLGALAWVVGKASGKDVMGFADVILMLFLGSLLGFGAAVLALWYGAMGALIGFAARVVPIRYRRLALLSYTGLFLGGVLLGGTVFLVVQMLLLLLALPARGESMREAPVPLGTWLCVGAVLAVAVSDPFAIMLESWFPWHATGLPGLLFHVSHIK